MKTIVSALIALSILAGIAAPASAEEWPQWARDGFARSHPSS
jgi:hypothetical protein